MGKIARLLRDKDFVRNLLKCRSKEEVLAVIDEFVLRIERQETKDQR
ncbi:PTS sugar transporter subunit IIA [Candidatus Calescamantes bacterium]|nr:PTS sugar transporter subunit IIA [Candidatus Calescamantes bacterium]